MTDISISIESIIISVDGRCLLSMVLKGLLEHDGRLGPRWDFCCDFRQHPFRYYGGGDGFGYEAVGLRRHLHMNIHYRHPTPPLSEYVEVIWLGEGGSPGHQLERVLPTGSMGIIVGLSTDDLTVIDRLDHARMDRFGSAIMIGPHAKHFVIDAADQAAVLGVHFRPGGARPFLGCPADELFDIHVSLDCLWGDGAGRFRERLLGCESPDAMLADVERAMAARLLNSKSRDAAVAFAIAALSSKSNRPTTAALADRLGWSQRHFIEAFRGEVGFTPKMFGRIQRFQQAIDCVEASSGVVDWAGIAACCGYYDQSHLIHDFRDFVDLTPSAYLRQRGPNRNHVPIPSQNAVA